MVILLLSYWSCGFIHSAEDFFKIYLVMALVGQCGIGIGLLISASVNNPTTAISFIPLVITSNFMLSGLIANSDLMPSFISWTQWLSVFRYANEATLTVLFTDVNEFTKKALEL